MAWMTWRRRLEYLGFRAIVCLVQMLSPMTSRELAEGAADFFCRWLPRKWIRYHVAEENLRQAFGNEATDEFIHKTILGMWTHLFRMVIEVIQLPRRVRVENCLDFVEYDAARAACWRAFNSGRPVILLGGHFGNWEVANALFGMFGMRMGVVARDLDNPDLHDWFAKFREHTGHVMISKSGAAEAMLPLLAHRGHLGLLGDQDAGPRGVFADFFGKPASCFKSIALMALEHRAVICVGGAIRLPDDDPHDWPSSPWSRFRLCCEEVIDPEVIDCSDRVGEITRRYTAALERLVRRAPEQYFWVHRRWKSQPQQRRTLREPRKAA